MAQIYNTHVHVPPNFSAFATPAELIAQASAEHVSLLGVSNFYDQSVYSVVKDLAGQAGMTILYGLEIITVLPDLRERGIRVNDPANPGRMYLTGKGIDPFAAPSPRTAQILAQIRRGNDSRAEQMVALAAQLFAGLGFDTGLDAQTLIARVAHRAHVPKAWVSLQERHIAQALQEELEVLPPDERAVLLQSAYGTPVRADLTDPAAVQAEIRSRLLKAGTPCFAEEVDVSFEDAYSAILDMGGIPCYPILADGCNPICGFEASPQELARNLKELGIPAAEFIPGRNHRALVDDYARVLTDAGLILMAGTEHNTADKIPFEPVCADGPISETTRSIFAQGARAALIHAASTGKSKEA